MNYSGVMCRGQRAGDLYRHLQYLAELHRSASHALAQRLAIDEFSGDEMYALPYGRATAPLVDLMNGDDVGMIQGGSGLGLLDKPLHSIRVSSNVSRQNLQRNFAIQPCVQRQINLTHSARPQL